MTEEQFNDFLHEIGGLISAYNQTKILTASSFSFGPGWYEITKNLITDLIALGWDKHLCQANEIFGGGRFYIGGATKEIFDRISQWEKETFETCENCGTKENVRVTNYGWVRTLCDDCRQTKTNAT